MENHKELYNMDSFSKKMQNPIKSNSKYGLNYIQLLLYDIKVLVNTCTVASNVFGNG